MLLPDLSPDPRRLARHLYFQGYGVTSIAEKLAQPRSTVAAWKTRDEWDATRPIDRVEQSLEARMCFLILKEDKSGTDFKEIDLLGRQIAQIARVQRYQGGGNEADLNPKVANRNRGEKKKPLRNEYSPEQAKRLIEAYHEGMFEYQRIWHEAGLSHRIRHILKSRQVGATLHFSREAFVDSIETGRNQIFLSASRAQANVFKQYIQKFARSAADIELKGGRDSPIILPNDAELHFLGTNAHTAQSYHGNLYFEIGRAHV